MICNFYLSLGTLEFPLIAVPRAAKTHMESSLEQLPEQGHDVELDDLFDKKRVKGWWPIYKIEQNNERTPMVNYNNTLVKIY